VSTMGRKFRIWASSKCSCCTTWSITSSNDTGVEGVAAAVAGTWAASASDFDEAEMGESCAAAGRFKANASNIDSQLTERMRIQPPFRLSERTDLQNYPDNGFVETARVTQRAACHVIG